MPTLGGWAAAANELDPNSWILFAILFLWQHPHFYAIALMCKKDYEKAGFKMLPVIEELSCDDLSYRAITLTSLMQTNFNA